jgi:hypothetical protein
VAGAGAGRYAVIDRYRQSANGVAGQQIEVGKVGRLELAAVSAWIRQPAQPVDDAEDDLRVVRGGETAQQFGVHEAILERPSPALQRALAVASRPWTAREGKGLLQPGLHTIVEI